MGVFLSFQIVTVYYLLLQWNGCRYAFLKMFPLILLVINVLFPYRIPASYILIGYAGGNVFCVIVRFG